MIDQELVQDWLDRYVAAWVSGDPGDVGRLFAAEARYRFHPHEDPIVGREAIVDAWLSDPDEPGTFEAEYHPFAVDGDRAVAIGWSRYFVDAEHSAVEATYDNSFALEFDGDGRCRAFTEWFVKRP